MSRWLHFIPLSQRTADSIPRLLVETASAALFTALIYLLYCRYPALSTKVVGTFRVSARRAGLYVLAAMLLPLVLRLALLPWLPPPTPRLHDEFVHILAADTLAAGRLANPPHPLWRHLEAIYVLQQPAYASQYPLGPGIVLAVGKLLTGIPWAGVLLAVALMCGATSWMLFGCLPPQWAAIGGLLAALHYSLAYRWVNSYWGGAFSAFGGALLFGALCRLLKSPSRAMASLVGLGWSIVWLSRPFESLLPLILFWGLIAVFIIREPRLWRRWLGPIIVILSIQIAAGCVTALHNRAVTGSFTTLPYQLSQRVYGVPQSLLWQKPIEEPPLRFAELKQMYWWQRNTRDNASAQPLRRWIETLHTTWRFFVGPWYSLPIVLLLFQLKDRQVIVGAGAIAGALAASVLYPFFFPHYIAAYSCVFAFLIIRGMMALRQWSFRGREVGPLAVLFLMLGGSVMSLRMVPVRAVLGLAHNTGYPNLRARVSDRLMRFGGRHAVFIRYGATHSFQDEWVYNAAEIDSSPIVWCQTMGATDDVEVARYYKDRHLWIADVDKDTVRVSHYQPETPVSASANHPGDESQDWVLREAK